MFSHVAARAIFSKNKLILQARETKESIYIPLIMMLKNINPKLFLFTLSFVIIAQKVETFCFYPHKVVIFSWSLTTDKNHNIH